MFGESQFRCHVCACWSQFLCECFSLLFLLMLWQRRLSKRRYWFDFWYKHTKTHTQMEEKHTLLSLTTMFCLFVCSFVSVFEVETFDKAIYCMHFEGRKWRQVCALVPKHESAFSSVGLLLFLISTKLTTLKVVGTIFWSICFVFLFVYLLFWNFCNSKVWNRGKNGNPNFLETNTTMRKRNSKLLVSETPETWNVTKQNKTKKLIQESGVTEYCLELTTLRRGKSGQHSRRRL